MDRFLHLEALELPQDFSPTHFELPVSVIDLTHPALPHQVRSQLLTMQYYGQYLQDGLNTGHVSLNQHGTATFHSKVNLSTYLGYAFEAYVVRKLNEGGANNKLKRNAIMWCSHRSQTDQKWIDEWTAIGTGLKETQIVHPMFYITTDTSDVRFVRTVKSKKSDIRNVEPLTLLENKMPAGIQIKAITGNEQTEIINPLRSKKYSCVLTMLRRQNGHWFHSHDACMQMLKNMHYQGLIGQEEREQLERKIYRPSQLGFDEKDVNEYAEYIRFHFPNFHIPEASLVATANIEIGRCWIGRQTFVSTDALTKNIIIEE
jgi:hypothetical protein